MDCQHLRDASSQSEAPRARHACAECLAQGLSWVRLRVCLSCGHVGCCDSSDGRHATAHYHASGHPVMQSAEPGERWRWCYIDEVMSASDDGARPGA